MVGLNSAARKIPNQITLNEVATPIFSNHSGRIEFDGKK